MIPHAVRHIFDIDDDVTGNGTVNAIAIFWFSLMINKQFIKKTMPAVFNFVKNQPLLFRVAKGS